MQVAKLLIRLYIIYLNKNNKISGKYGRQHYNKGCQSAQS